MCTTTTHWATHISPECSPGGSGQCDGNCSVDYMTECTCSCHTEWDLPITTAGVLEWHDVRNGVVARTETFEEARDIADRLRAGDRVHDGVRGADYRVCLTSGYPGQHYVQAFFQ